MQTSQNLKSNLSFMNKSTVYLSINLIPRYIRLVVWVLSVTDPVPYFLLGDRIVSLIRFSGPLHTVMYLKEALRIIQKFISGEKQTESDGIRMGLASGLPSILPSSLRASIRGRETNEIRAILTIVSLFRVLRYEPKLKLSTITDPFKGLCPTLPRFELKNVLEELKPQVTFLENIPHISFAAGPNKSPAGLGLSLDAYALKDHPHLLEAIRTLSNSFGGNI